MKTNILTILLLTFGVCHLPGQTATDLSTGKHLLHVHHVDGSHNDTEYNPTLFNFNTYEQVNAGEFALKFPIADVEKYSFFIVFSYNSAASLVNIRSDQRNLKLTPTTVESRRDLPVNLEPDYANILMYSGSSGKEIEDTFTSEFRVGPNSSGQDKGTIFVSEILMFDYVLPRKKAKIIQSRLALKYGVSLPPDSSYVNSTGQIVFDPIVHENHTHNVVALVKDNGLAISQTTNTRDDFFQIGLGKITPVTIGDLKGITEGSYVFIGDNNKPLTFTDGLLDRRWELSGNLSAVQNKKFNIKLDRSRLDEKHRNQEYDLVFSKSKNFESDALVSYRLSNIGNYLLANDITIPDEDGVSLYATVRKTQATSVASDDVDIRVNTLVTHDVPLHVSIFGREGVLSGSIEIYSAAGYLIHHDAVSRLKQYQGQFQLPYSGTYFLTYRSENICQTKKIVAQ